MRPSSNTPLEEIAALLQAASRVLVLCHVHPDGDAIGSLLGLGWLLRGLPPRLPGAERERLVSLVCQDPVPDDLAFMPGAGAIRQSPPDEPWDVVVSLDASDPARLGQPFKQLERGAAPLVVIDHHITNLYFGDVNHVNAGAAATSQILTELAGNLGVAITRDAATCLLTGIVTDTLGFRTNNTTGAVVAAAVALIEAGASLADISQRTLNDKDLTVLRLWGMAFARARLDGQVLWVEVTREMRREAGLAGDDDGGLVSQLINAREARIAVVFNELADGEIEIDFRARRGYDVATVALGLGGGGHPQASGCTLPGALAEVRARVLPLLAAAAEQGADL